MERTSETGGTTCKTIFDCTAPYPLKERFARARFLDIDDEKLARSQAPSDNPLIL